MIPEEECHYFKAKGMHLYVPYSNPQGNAVEACYGCGRQEEQDD